MTEIPKIGKNEEAREYGRLFVEFNMSFFYGMAKAQLKEGATDEELVDAVANMQLKEPFVAMELECFKDFLAKRNRPREAPFFGNDSM